MVDYLQLLLLGAVAGLTVFLGLPIAILQNVSRRTKGFLNAFSIGILVFLIADVLFSAWEAALEASVNAYKGQATVLEASLSILAMIGGTGLGIFMLVFYEKQRSKSLLISAEQAQSITVHKPTVTGDGKTERVVLQQQQIAELLGNPYHLASMIALGIGLHNFAEGLAIGQSYVSGAVSLALVLIVGFAAHNATEGFGIAGPLATSADKPKISFLLRMGLTAGGPTFVGTIVGSLFQSSITYILFLSLAAGALVYVTLFMYSSGRRHASNDLMMVGVFVGIVAGLLTDLIVSLGGA